MELPKVNILIEKEIGIIKEMKVQKKIYYIWILNFYMGKFGYKNLKSKYTWNLNFYIEIFPYKNLKSMYTWILNSYIHPI